MAVDTQNTTAATDAKADGESNKAPGTAGAGAAGAGDAGKDGAATKSEPSEADALKAKIATLEAALVDANKVGTDQTTALQARLTAVEAEAVSERRTTALTRMGLPPAYHDVAPKGDPKDPAVATALDAWAAAHPLLLQSRAPVGPHVDLEALAKTLPGGGKGLTNMSNMQANWAAMRGEK